MEILGPSLENLLHACGKKLSFATVLFLIEQMVFIIILYWILD